MRFNSSRACTSFALALFAVLCAAAPVRADILYVTVTAGNAIEKFTSGGFASVFASSGLNRPEDHQRPGAARQPNVRAAAGYHR